MAFGNSLHVDLYGVSRDICGDLTYCYELLDDLVAFLGMQKQSPPSGISIHTLSLREFVTVDIYTCGQMETADAVAFLCQRLKTSRCDHQHLVRGIKYGT